jgi:hypothetical protein
MMPTAALAPPVYTTLSWKYMAAMPDGIANGAGGSMPPLRADTKRWLQSASLSP